MFACDVEPAHPPMVSLTWFWHTRMHSYVVNPAVVLAAAVATAAVAASVVQATAAKALSLYAVILWFSLCPLVEHVVQHRPICCRI